MDENQVQTIENLSEFLKLLLKGELRESRSKAIILQNLCATIKNTLEPSIITFSLYNHESELLTSFFTTGDQLADKLLQFEVDTFDEENPYTESFISKNTLWVEVDSLEDTFPGKEELIELNVSEIIIAPILYKNNIAMGALSVYLFPETVKYNEEKYIEVVNEISLLITEIVSSWSEEYSSQLRQQQTELIVEMSNLTLETTEIQIILNSILPKVKSRTAIEGIGVFIKDVDRFDLIKHVGLNKEIEDYYSSPELEISSLPYYNTSNVIDEIDFTLYPEKYGVILPIGTTNLMFGFLLILSTSQEELTESNIHFLRIVANQLFLTIQRKRLLDDIQQITQTSEFSSFPIILVNNKFEIIYLNKQAEKTFNLNHYESIGLKLDSSLNIEINKAKLIWQKVKDVIANIAKNSMKIDIEVYQAGKLDTRTFFVQLSPTINNLTGEYCVVLSLVDITEATKLQSIAEEYSNRSRMYLNVLTHDIYNILFGISGYYELLSSSIQPENKIIVERVSKLVKRGTAIVQDIRLLTNVMDISTGSEVNFIPLRMTILRVLDKIKGEFSEKKINVEINIPSNIKAIGGAFLYEMFLYVMTSLVQKANNQEIFFEISGEEFLVNEESEFEIVIVDKEGTPPDIKEEIHRALDLSPFDETVRKHLGFMIVNEIAKKYNYNVIMEDLDKEDWEKGSAIKISMPISTEIENNEDK
ncbi:MAG: HAMP domain-containing histidine kinase [Candidatus Heimdallarchaeota archaeon]|nr:HAMP domain-containing histidine kinase [Candidatus Heimdallarchaeota archaeon]MCK4954189.1 HAMP domain-containing histidine kinase [Candidatus Heimdallarchaeota archaeon]